MAGDRHEFGGPWTEVKLDALNEYSRFYTTALQSQRFDLWYIDAFAGTGSRTTAEVRGGLLEGQPVERVEITLDGSATRALGVQPEFKHLAFVEERPKHYRALCELAAKHPGRDVIAIKGDANAVLAQIFSQAAWQARDTGWKQRALVFLDPYGINVRWTTLQALAATERADVWYLVNLKGVYQQLARRHDRLDESKRQALGDFFEHRIGRRSFTPSHLRRLTCLG